MSTTDKLAQLMKRGREAEKRIGMQVWRGDGGSHICVGYLIGELLSALESQSTPAGEVTADAVEVALRARVPGGAQVFHWLPMIDGREPHETALVVMQAALAAALPALTQQVEDMKESVHQWRRQYNIECENLTKVEAERDTLSAENARLAKDAEMVNSAIGGKYIFFKERHGVGHQTTRALSQLIDFIAKKRDAAAAQANQAEGE
jgi:hypothetical protein